MLADLRRPLAPTKAPARFSDRTRNDIRVVEARWRRFDIVERRGTGVRIFEPCFLRVVVVLAGVLEMGNRHLERVVPGSPQAVVLCLAVYPTDRRLCRLGDDVWVVVALGFRLGGLGVRPCLGVLEPSPVARGRLATVRAAHAIDTKATRARLLHVESGIGHLAHVECCAAHLSHTLSFPNTPHWGPRRSRDNIWIIVALVNMVPQLHAPSCDLLRRWLGPLVWKTPSGLVLAQPRPNLLLRGVFADRC
mmetsp:Transcript_36240/g.72741  ORF Transcript_36240/g.72741 Transcript_36240/m.72741 type:complete len:249 (-) Transcript_36240:517-1263(-)